MSSSLSTSRSRSSYELPELVQVPPTEPAADDLDDVVEPTERNAQLRRERSAQLTAELLVAD